MPPRPSLRPLVRQLQASAPRSVAPISSTSKNAALSDIGSGGSAANELTNFDESATTTGRAPSQQRRQGAGGGADMLNAMLQKTGGFERLAKNKEDFKEKAKNITARAEVSRQMTREWHKGDVYTPRDLGWFEAKMWKQPKKPTKDIIDVLGINPLDHYKNFAMMSEFMTEMGRIKHPNDTGLRPVNQRKMAKAIRRAIGMGIHPSTHRHQNILFNEARPGPMYDSSKNPDKGTDKAK